MGHDIDHVEGFIICKPGSPRFKGELKKTQVLKHRWPWTTENCSRIFEMTILVVIVISLSAQIFSPIFIVVHYGQLQP